MSISHKKINLIKEQLVLNIEEEDKIHKILEEIKIILNYDDKLGSSKYIQKYREKNREVLNIKQNERRKKIKNKTI
jgi:pyruvate-formate lyase-activating enzyme